MSRLPCPAWNATSATPPDRNTLFVSRNTAGRSVSATWMTEYQSRTPSNAAPGNGRSVMDATWAGCLDARGVPQRSFRTKGRRRGHGNPDRSCSAASVRCRIQRRARGRRRSEAARGSGRPSRGRQAVRARSRGSERHRPRPQRRKPSGPARSTCRCSRPQSPRLLPSASRPALLRASRTRARSRKDDREGQRSSISASEDVG